MGWGAAVLCESVGVQSESAAPCPEGAGGATAANLRICTQLFKQVSTTRNVLTFPLILTLTCTSE